MRQDAAELLVEVERALTAELRKTYDYVNWSLFRERLKRPSIELLQVTSQLGRWVRYPPRIELSRSFVFDEPWGAVVEVMKHEMAHQYVDECLHASGESAHGPAFREVCRERAIDATAAGVPTGSAATGDVAVLERISKLLALATSSNEHEAQSAMNAARRLMLKYNLEHVGSSARAYSFRQVGQPTGRVEEAHRVLSHVLSTHFFVEAIWASVWRPWEAARGTVLKICGTPENLAIAAYVYDFMDKTANRLWDEHRRRHRIRSNRDRRTFRAGVMAGFLQKLDAEKRVSDAEGLVWIGDSDLEEYYRKRNPRTRTIRRTGGERNAARAHGQAAGRNVVLHRGVSDGPTESGPKLLGK